MGFCHERLECNENELLCLRLNITHVPSFQDPRYLGITINLGYYPSDLISVISVGVAGLAGYGVYQRRRINLLGQPSHSSIQAILQLWATHFPE